MKYAYFPGCSIHHSTAKEYEKSSLAVSKILGIELDEIPGWTCCGSIDGVYAYDPTASLALAARNLLLAGKISPSVVTLCSACFFTLSRAQKMLLNDPDQREQVQKKYDVGSDLGNVKVRHFLDILTNDIGYDEISKHVKVSLKDLKVASYYGCLIVRPPGIGSFDDPEHPKSLERMVEKLGAKSVELPDKTRCCGASMSITHEEAMVEMTRRILDNAKTIGADCIVTACPLCQFNLDAKQSDVEGHFGVKFDLPVLFITQLMGLAFGLTPKEVGLNKNFVAFNKIPLKAPSPVVQMATTHE